ncbi:hypothetical protein CsSME_00015852 [Camellia sinensis var. sinensis]
MAGFSRLQFVFLFFLVASMSTIQVSLCMNIMFVECPAACAKRCSATSHLNNCLMFCNLCCDKCLCVPSGTYGHKEECPCYNNWKTKKGGPKCP